MVFNRLLVKLFSIAGDLSAEFHVSSFKFLIRPEREHASVLMVRRVWEKGKSLKYVDIPHACRTAYLTILVSLFEVF